MNKIPIIFDCDPGHDDAIALIFAFAQASLDIKAVTTVAGNAGLDKTLINAKKILGLLGRRPLLAAGAAKPMFRNLVTAPQVHGESGLDGPAIPLPDYPEEKVNAVELMRRLITESPEPVTIIATGPLTNLGILFTAFPEVKKNISTISLMGGAIGAGNWTSAAEFNIYVDPEAADIVFSSGVPLVMSGLDVTTKALIMKDEIDVIRSLGGAVPVLTADLLDFYFQFYKKNGYPGAALHDPCAVACLTHPALFTGRRYHVVVETKGKHTDGMTLADLRPYSDAKPNAIVNMDIDRKEFIKVLTEACAAYPKA
ncbi:MAG: nucleoside hydrolase [Treponema sp.]|jgi:pyrimidine-specific ribonucleoside hydrolase|nr:nucleoside hydrolase [Treponema sp.]